MRTRWFGMGGERRVHRGRKSPVSLQQRVAVLHQMQERGHFPGQSVGNWEWCGGKLTAMCPRCGTFVSIRPDGTVEGGVDAPCTPEGRRNTYG